jgi:hypothetical protein
MSRNELTRLRVLIDVRAGGTAGALNKFKPQE